MPTPASGAISMNDMNVQITRAGGTATVDMNTIRTRFGGSGAISFSDLHDCEGFTVTCGTYSSKFISFDGWNVFLGTGSVSPNESSGHLQFAAASFLAQMESFAGTNDSAALMIYSDTGGATIGVTAGYKASDITRVVTANTSRTLTGTPDDNSRNFTYDFPASGTIHCLIKF